MSTGMYFFHTHPKITAACWRNDTTISSCFDTRACAIEDDDVTSLRVEYTSAINYVIRLHYVTYRILRLTIQFGNPDGYALAYM